MFKHLVRKRKALSAVMAALLMGGAYQAGGCSVNLDQAFLQSVLDQVLASDANFGFHFNNRGGGRHDGGGGGDMDDDMYVPEEGDEGGEYVPPLE